MRSSQALGYLSVRVWDLLPDGSKVLSSRVDAEWVSRKCVFGSTPCEPCPLTDSIDNTAMIIYRAPLLPGENRTSPFTVAWVDPTGVVRAMNPRLDDTLKTLHVMPVKGGTSFAFRDVWARFSVYISVLIVFAGLLILLLSFACVRRKRAQAKGKYVLDTRGYRTITGRIKRRLPKQQKEVISNNHLRWWHAFYISCSLAVQVVWSLMFTITFCTLVFVSINKEHFEVIDQYSTWSSSRDAQLRNITDQIERQYQAEKTRINAAYTSVSGSCLNQDLVMQAVFDELQANITAYHDAQFLAPPVSALSALEEVNGTFACSIAGGANYERDSISFLETIGTEIHERFLFPTANEELIRGNLSAWCSLRESCRGFAYDRSGPHYYLYEIVPEPVVPPQGGLPGFCYIKGSLIWPTLAQVFQNRSNLEKEYLAEYQEEVRHDINITNKLIKSYKSNESFIADYFVDRSPVKVGEGQKYKLASILTKTTTRVDSSGTTTTSETDIGYRAPGMPERMVEPVLKKVQDFVGNSSFENGTFVRSNESVSVANSMSIAVVNITEPNVELPTLDKFVIFPEWAFQAADVVAIIVAAVLIFDLTWVMIRWFYIFASTAQYVLGIDTHIGDKEVGRTRSWFFALLCRKFMCCGCIRSCFRCMNDIDNVVWKLIKKIWELVLLASIVFVILLAYYLVDQLISTETIGAFGVFQGMTLQQTLQRTVRNEELTALAQSKNTLGSASLSLGVEKKGAELLLDQFQFNLDEKARVDEWNDRYCTAATEFITSPHSLSLTGNYSFFPSFPSQWPHTGQTAEPSSRTLSVERGTFSVSVYRLSEVVLDWEYTAGNVTSMLYRVFLSMNETHPRLNATVSSNYTIESTSNSSTAVQHLIKFSPAVPAHALLVDVLQAGDGYRLASVTAEGSANADDLTCPRVQWQQMNFKPNDYLGDCRDIAAIHGRMVRLWDRGDWTKGMETAHEPYIQALRNIALSPFVILIAGLIIMASGALISAIVEWFLMSADLIKQNKYAVVPVSLVAPNAELEVFSDDDVSSVYTLSSSESGPESLYTDEYTDDYSSEYKDDDEYEDGFRTPPRKDKKQEMNSRVDKDMPRPTCELEMVEMTDVSISVQQSAADSNVPRPATDATMLTTGESSTSLVESGESKQSADEPETA